MDSTSRVIVFLMSFAVLAVGVLKLGCGPSRAELRALARQNDELHQQVVARLAKVHEGLNRAEVSKLPASCPAGRPAGNAIVIQSDWLAWAGAGAIWEDSPYEPERFDSRPFASFRNRAVESNKDSLERRIAAQRALLVAPVVVSLHLGQSEAARREGDGSFRGGWMTGTLAVHDVETGDALCAAPVMSRPLFAISLKQRRSGDQGLADDLALSSSASSSYWRAVKTALSKAAPAVKLLRDTP